MAGASAAVSAASAAVAAASTEAASVDSWQAQGEQRNSLAGCQSLLQDLQDSTGQQLNTHVFHRALGE